MLSSKIRLNLSLVISKFLYACELCTSALTAELERRVQRTDMKCYRRLLSMSYKDNITINAAVRNCIRRAVGLHEDL